MDSFLNQIIEGDCLEVMKGIPDHSIDMLFTDPPYKLTGGGKGSSLLRKPELENCAFTTTGEVFADPTPEFSDWIPLLYRVLKESAYVFIMSNDRNLREIWGECENSGLIFCELLVMDKGAGVPSSYFFKSAEFVLMFRKGGYKKLEVFGHKTVFNVKMPIGENKVHPTEKPIDLIIPIIMACSKEGNVILDPFVGSGTTALAALNTGRFFIGIEKDEGYREIARKRVEQAQAQGNIFAEA